MLREKLLALVAMLCFSIAATAQFSVNLDGTNPTCNGFGNGTITANVSGGTSPYIYSYSNGFSGPMISGLSAGTYDVTVTDANNETATASVILNDPAAIDGNLSLNDVCSGNGNVTSAASGGTGGYSYSWTNGQTAANATGLAPGINCVTITDGNGCQGISCLTVYGQLSVDVTSSALPCFDACDASVTATVSGGNGPYSFIWNTGSTASILEAVPTGTYTVTVTDANGCTDTGTSVVGAPGQVVVNVDVVNPQCGIGAVGSATASATGGTPPYQYFWSDGQSGPTASNLPPGNYNVVVTDAAGCQEMVGFAIVPDGGFDLDISTTPTSDCGAMDGTASVTAGGGVAPYTYLWSTGSTDTSISGLAPGSYGVTVTDSDGCATVGMATVGGAPGITLNVMGMDPVCGSMDGGTAVVQAFDGTPPYTYAWSNGSTMNVIGNLDQGTYTVTVTDAAGCSATGSAVIAASGSLDVTAFANGPACDGLANASATAVANNGVAPYTYAWSNGGNTATISGIGAGTYTVTITDASGCSGTATATVNSSPGLVLNINTIPIDCFGGSGVLGVEVSGGLFPFTYSWSNGTVIASNGLIPAGQYSVTVTDAAGCSGTASANLTQPNPLVLDLTTNDGGCDGGASGSATASGAGGTPPYNYAWSNGSSSSSVSGLGEGNYSMTLTDANGCAQQQSFSIAEFGNPNCNVAITTPISTSGGSDGAATVTAYDGTGPYFYNWSNGQTTETAIGLSAGAYTVTVTDQNGCTTTCSVSFQDPAKLGDRIFIDANRNGCQDTDESGWFGLTVYLNGTDINGNTMGQTTTTDVFGNYIFDGLIPGNYTVRIVAPAGYMVTDKNQCGDSSDSDANVFDGTTDPVNLSAGECDLTVDIGIYEICDQVDDPGEICCDQTLCAPGNTPDPITSLAPATGGFGDLEYLWMSSTTQGPFNPNTWTIIPGATGLEYAPGPLYETTYYARCARRDGCTAYVETTILTIVVSADFAAVINGPDLVCVDDVVTYSSNQSGPGVTYLWNFGNLANPSTATTQTVDVTWSNFTSTTISLTISNGDCTSSNTMGVAVTDSPIHCGPGANNLVANVNDNGTVSLAWFAELSAPTVDFTIERSQDGIEFTALETMDAHTSSEYAYLDVAPMRGESFYRVMMEDQYGTIAYSEMASVNIAQSNDPFFLYPNPFTSELTISIDETIESNVQVTVYRPDGRTVRSLEIQNGDYGQQLNLDGMASGIYYVHFQFGNEGNRVVRVVKE